MGCQCLTKYVLDVRIHAEAVQISAENVFLQVELQTTDVHDVIASMSCFFTLEVPDANLRVF